MDDVAQGAGLRHLPRKRRRAARRLVPPEEPGPAAPPAAPPPPRFREGGPEAGAGAEHRGAGGKENRRPVSSPPSAASGPPAAAPAPPPAAGKPPAARTRNRRKRGGEVGEHGKQEARHQHRPASPPLRTPGGDDHGTPASTSGGTQSSLYSSDADELLGQVSPQVPRPPDALPVADPKRRAPPEAHDAGDLHGPQARGGAPAVPRADPARRRCGAPAGAGGGAGEPGAPTRPDARGTEPSQTP